MAADGDGHAPAELSVRAAAAPPVGGRSRRQAVRRACQPPAASRPPARRQPHGLSARPARSGRAGRFPDGRDAPGTDDRGPRYTAAGGTTVPERTPASSSPEWARPAPAMPDPVCRGRDTPGPGRPPFPHQRSAMTQQDTEPVFLDRSERRRRAVVWLGTAGGALLAVAVVVLLAGFTGSGPRTPDLPADAATPHSTVDGKPRRDGGVPAPAPAGTTAAPSTGPPAPSSRSAATSAPAAPTTSARGRGHRPGRTPSHPAKGR